MSKRKRRVPGYVQKVKYLAALGVIPKVGVSQVAIYHDGWCKHVRFVHPKLTV
jgi:hypothetical protein